MNTNFISRHLKEGAYFLSPATSDRKIKINQLISSLAARTIIGLSPELVLGTHRLFKWDAIKNQITLSEPFQNLLQLLTELKTLETTEIRTLAELNALLQKKQGQGGLMRAAERPDVVNLPGWDDERDRLQTFFAELGFVERVQPSSSFPSSIPHCIVFGALVPRMELRIQETVECFSKENVVPEKIFFLGSTRALNPEEHSLLADKIEGFTDETRKRYWKEVLADPSQAIEANAFVLLWESFLQNHLKEGIKGEVIFARSTRLGSSYPDQEGDRATTDVTTDDWAVSYYKEGEMETILALAEQPFGRLLDQLRASVLTNGKQASLDRITQRIARTTFYFLQPKPKQAPLTAIVLDEIARHVYRSLNILHDLEKHDLEKVE